MRAWGDGYVVAGYRGGASPRWREAFAVAAAAALPLTVCTAAAQPALAAGGFTVTAGIPVTILSAEASPAIIRYMRTRGVIAYLTKPLDLAELGQPLDSFMAGHDHGAAPAPRSVPAR